MLRKDYRFKFSFSSRIINKPDPRKTDMISFCREEGTWESLLEHIKKGHAICPGIFNKGQRRRSNFIAAWLLMIDIDNKDNHGDYAPRMTLQQARENEFISKYGLIYTTPSHTPQWNRFRVIFFTERIDDLVVYEEYIIAIDKILGKGVIDICARDCSRLFYGNTKAQILYDDGITQLDIGELIKNVEKKKTIYKLESRKYEDADESIVIEALNCISADCDYDRWFRVMCALHNYYQGSDRGFELFNQWSASSAKYDGADKLFVKWKSLEGSDNVHPITIATVFHYAKDEGFYLENKNKTDPSTQTRLNTNNNKDSSKKMNKDDSKRLALEVIEQEYGDRIRLNRLTLEIELDGKFHDFERFYLDLDIEHGISVSKNTAYDLVVRHAENNEYHPIRDYLKRCCEENKECEVDISELSTYFFGTNKKIYDEYLYRHLLGSVQRILFPGSKKDECLVLKGAQGAGKSSFFSVLYSPQFFDDSVNGNSKDDLLIAHRNWCLELAEIEYITRRKESGELKNFLSKSADTFREPYGRVTRYWPRGFVFVGSVNEDSFLKDMTGNRRFWVIPVERQVDLDKLAYLRDQIWAEVCRHLNYGATWNLDEEFWKEQEKESIEHIDCDEWTEDVLHYICGRNQVKIADVLTNCIGYEQRHIDLSAQRRVGKILRLNGWKKKHTMYGKVWVNPL